MIYIRTDSNNTIATGHVMRCLSIAKAMRKIDEECIFITADNNSDELINSNDFETICLESAWEDLDGEIEPLINVIKERKIKKLLIDSYSVTKNYLNILSKYTKLIYIDDINLFTYPVDMLINYSGSYTQFKYDMQYKDTKTKLILGYNYVPLREEFCNIKPVIREKVKEILFTMGGADENKITSRFIENIINSKSYNTAIYHIVVGILNKNLDGLNKLVANYPTIKLHYNVKRMAELMKKCDIAISAGGTTLLELCACGIPTISFTLADNQKEGTKSLADDKTLIYVGDVRDDSKACMKSIFKNIQMLMDDIVFRDNLSTKMNNLIDGSGVKRLVNEIQLL